MSRKHYSVSEIKSITPEQLLKMNYKEVRNLYNQARFLSEARDRAASKSPIKVPVRLYDGRRSVTKGFDVNEGTRSRLIHEIRGFQAYLSTKSSTKQGTLELRADVIARIEKYSGYAIPEEDYDTFWNYYALLRNDVAESTVGGKYEMWRKIGEIMSTANYSSYDDFKSDFLSKEFPTEDEVEDDDEFFYIPTFGRDRDI